MLAVTLQAVKVLALALGSTDKLQPQWVCRDHRSPFISLLNNNQQRTFCNNLHWKFAFAVTFTGDNTESVAELLHLTLTV